MSFLQGPFYTVLEDINLEINKGECLYIHGKNGCGKSTLFKIICDIIQTDSGTIEKKPDTYIGALIENPGFIENESLRFNLEFLASINHHYNEERIRELCHMYSLEYDCSSTLKNYSVGMRQKAGIIQAVMEDQNLIFFDEPTRGLDEESIIVFENMVNTLVEGGKSIVIASLLRTMFLSSFYFLYVKKYFISTLLFMQISNTSFLKDLFILFSHF